MLELLLQGADGRLGHVKSVSEDERTREHSETARLVGSSQRNRHHVDERGDTQGDLHGDEMHETKGALSGVGRQGGTDTAPAGVDKEGKNGTERAHSENAVIHLYGAGVLKHVAPPQVGLVLATRVKLVPELRGRWREAQAHLGKLVVDEAGIETGDQSTRHGGDEDESGDAENRAAEVGENRVVDGLDGRERGLRIGGHAARTQHRQARQEHPGVADKGGAQVGGQAVLRDAGVRALGKQVVLEARLDHPPADEALEANQGRDAEQVGGHLGGDAAAGHEVERRQDKAHANDTAPEPVAPFHKVNLFELVDGHVGVEDLVLGRGTVPLEFGFPVLLGSRGHRSGHGLPLCNAEAGWRSVKIREMVGDMRLRDIPGLCQPGQTSPDDNAKDANRATDEPVADRPGRRLGEDVLGLGRCLCGSGGGLVGQRIYRPGSIGDKES